MTLGQQFLKELEAEAAATKKCLERIPENLYDYKPHEKSMAMGYLALIVAEIPLWAHVMATTSEIDFVKFNHFQAKTAAELAKHFEDNMALARQSLATVSDEAMQEKFELKADGRVVMETTKEQSIGPSINHMVHHRGQLTVYMRLNNLQVPSIYGPSADEGGF